jgi:hypothetical protein
MDSARFDGLAKDLSRPRSRRRVVHALAATFGIAGLVRSGLHRDAQAAPGIKPLRCYKRGTSCIPPASPDDIDCCGRNVCNPDGLGGATCQRPLIIK